MTNMIINQRELSALTGLPYLQQLVYLRGLRPYVDYQTGVVGVKRGISYQSLSEELYIEPHPGIKSGSPHREQIRRALKSLERIGLISIQSQDWKLIIHCPLVITHFSAQNKVDTNETLKVNLNQVHNKPLFATKIVSSFEKENIVKSAQADIPLKSDKNNMCVMAHFEKFWSMYPKKNAKQKAWEIFCELQPSDELVNQILVSLQKQINTTETLQHHGLWIPKWKFPANWLAQHCWEDEIDTNALEELQHATNTKHHTKKQTTDILWESCKTGIITEATNAY